MTIKELRTKSREKRRREFEFNFFLRSPEEDKLRTSANFLKTPSKSTKPDFTTILLHTMAAILEALKLPQALDSKI
jgi:hypothetical protein